MKQPKPRVFERAPAVMDTAEAATLLGLSQGTVKRYCREGRLPSSKPGGKYLISKEALRQYLNVGQ